MAELKGSVMLTFSDDSGRVTIGADSEAQAAAMVKGMADFFNYPFNAADFMAGAEFFVWPDTIDRTKAGELAGMFHVNVGHEETMEEILDSVATSAAVPLPDGSTSPNSCQTNLGAKINAHLIADGIAGVRVSSAAWLATVPPTAETTAAPTSLATDAPTTAATDAPVEPTTNPTTAEPTVYPTPPPTT